MKHVCILMCSFLIGIISSLGAETVLEEKEQAELVCQALFGATKHSEMSEMVLQWEKEFPPKILDHLYNALFQKLESKTRLEVDELDQPIKHDLSIVGGRCAWALENLLGGKLHAVTIESNEEDLFKARQSASQYIRGAMQSSSRKVWKVKAELAYRALLGITKHSEMSEMVLRWDKDLSSKTLGSLHLTLYFNLGSKASVETKEIGENVGHDLSIVGGRCAWALEKLLRVKLPPVTGKSKEKELTETRRIVLDQIRKVEELTFKEAVKRAEAQVKLMSTDRKMELARGITTQNELLIALAGDDNIKVRRMIAANPGTSVHILGELSQNDPDPEVRQSASKNSIFARPVIWPEIKGIPDRKQGNK